MNLVPLEQLKFESFAALVKTKFCVCLEGADSVELELAEITQRKVSSMGKIPCETFTLTFRGPTTPFLPQQTYVFESAALGRFELFIVPVSRDETWTRYQATFNRVVPAK